MIAAAVALLIGGGLGLGGGWLVFGGDDSSDTPPETPTDGDATGTPEGGDQVTGPDAEPGAAEASYACDLAHSFDSSISMIGLSLDEPLLWQISSVEQLSLTAGIEDPQYVTLQESAQEATERHMMFDEDGMNDSLDDVRAACDDLGLPSGDTTTDDRAEADAAMVCVLIDAFEEDEQTLTWGGIEDDPHYSRIAGMQALATAASLADGTYQTLDDHTDEALDAFYAIDDDGLNAALTDVRAECESLGL
ncbi:hypothetical protein CZ771_03930 [Actinomycetales bacterium JB111]|nr:hypothetical protein CZ771_03930 [Actinomycetales bacterium JB111]